MPIKTNINSEKHSGSYTSFGGTDITAVIGTAMLGTLQAISYSVTREKGPIYTMRGSADPLAFARGKRAIAGSIVFLTITEQSLISHVAESGVSHADGAAKSDEFFGNTADVRYDASNPDTLAALFDTVTNSAIVDADSGKPSYEKEVMAVSYADQLLPFDVHVLAANEYGEGMKKMFIGVEILNEGGGVSIDDLVIEEQYTYIARSLTKWKKVGVA